LRLRAAVVVFFFSGVAQPGYAAPQSEITPSAAVRQNCAIKGSVIDAVTNRGLRKAYLILGGLYASVTDDQGNFVFENVKPGSYVLNAEHQGYIDGYFGEAGSEPIKIKLAPGQTLLDIKIELTPQAVITGRVVNEDGDPWTHASVNMFRSKWSHGHRTIQSFSGEEVNDQGEFRIGQVPPGKYYLAAEPDSGWEMTNRPSGKDVTTRQPTWYSNSLDVEGAAPIIVAPETKYPAWRSGCAAEIPTASGESFSVLTLYRRLTRKPEGLVHAESRRKPLQRPVSLVKAGRYAPTDLSKSPVFRPEPTSSG
jgi:hypothetical protein